MSQERSVPGNLGEDVPPMTQPTSGGAPQLPPPLTLFGDGNPPSRHSGNASSNYPLHPVARPAAKFRALGSLPDSGRGDVVTRRTTSDDPACRQSTSVPTGV
ncbi:hypothetical protein BHM03_00014909 [Ensete ventricosum]|nr:hypothetical protein BHM03_00014909 [Ensete ventricosum]